MTDGVLLVDLERLAELGGLLPLGLRDTLLPLLLRRLLVDRVRVGGLRDGGGVFGPVLDLLEDRPRLFGISDTFPRL